MRKPVTVGLIAGTLLSVGLIGYLEWRWGQGSMPMKVSLPSPQLDPEEREHQSLPSLQEILPKIGFTQIELALSEAKFFAEKIRKGFLPRGWESDCAKNHAVTTCLGLRDYFEGKTFQPADKKPPRARVLSFDPKKADSIQKETFQDLLRRIPTWTLPQLKVMSAEALKSTSCPRNFSLALARKVENYLDQPEGWPLMSSLDEHGFACLRPSDPQAESLFFKRGLLKISHGDWTSAVTMLKQAKMAPTRRELERTLYWLSRAYRELRRPEESKAVSLELRQRYPLSWYAIMSAVEEGRDPLKEIHERPVARDVALSENSLINQRAIWLRLFLEFEENPSTVVKRYGDFLLKQSPFVEPGFYQYLARVFESSSYHRLQIMTLNPLVTTHPEAISTEVLKLLYPKPYYEEVNGTHHLDHAVVLGLIRQESAFDPNATSSAHALGLMQVLPSTARQLRRISKKELYDYNKNIRVGVDYLTQIIGQFDGSVEKALAAYNAGPTAVRRWENQFRGLPDLQLFLDLIPYHETRDYVPSILRNAYWYHRLYPHLTVQLQDDVITSEMLKSQLLDRLPVDKSAE